MILTVILVLHCSEGYIFLGLRSFSPDFITLLASSSSIPAFKNRWIMLTSFDRYKALLLHVTNESL